MMKKVQKTGEPGFTKSPMNRVRWLTVPCSSRKFGSAGQIGKYFFMEKSKGKKTNQSKGKRNDGSKG